MEAQLAPKAILVSPWTDIVVGKIIPLPKESHNSLWICEYVMLHEKRELSLQVELRLLIS